MKNTHSSFRVDVSVQYLLFLILFPLLVALFMPVVRRDTERGWIVKLSADGLATNEIQSTKINIYPNPVKETLNFSEEVSKIKITDLSGKMVKQASASAKSVNVSTLAKGVYIISATTKSGESINSKIVKE